MTDKECIEFARLLESELMIVWFDGKYQDGSSRWGAREMGFLSCDTKLTDPFMMMDSEEFADSPLAAVKAALAKRPKRKK